MSVSDPELVGSNPGKPGSCPNFRPRRRDADAGQCGPWCRVSASGGSGCRTSIHVGRRRDWSTGASRVRIRGDVALGLLSRFVHQYVTVTKHSWGTRPETLAINLNPGARYANRIAAGLQELERQERQRPSWISQLALEVGDADPGPCTDRDGHRFSAPPTHDPANKTSL